MVHFRTQRVTDRITRIYGVCTELCYLVEGDHTAALIDTCSGYGRLRPVVEQLTDKPLIVLLTHGHTDHAMGAAEFSDCAVCLNHLVRYIYGPHGAEDFRRAGMALAEEGTQLTEEDYIPTAPFSLFHDLRDGDTFDLGGEVIRACAVPGHTLGTLALLMCRQRILLLGDACNTFTFLYEPYCTSVDHYRQSLAAAKDRLAGQYDRILASHGDGELPMDIMDSVLQVCEDIQSGHTDDVPMEFRGARGLIAKAMGPQGRLDGGSGNIVYSRDQIWQDGSACAAAMQACQT